MTEQTDQKPDHYDGGRTLKGTKHWWLFFLSVAGTFTAFFWEHPLFVGWAPLVAWFSAFGLAIFYSDNPNLNDRFR